MNLVDNMLTIRRKTLTYIENMRIKELPYCQYRYSANTKKPVLYASVYAIMTTHLYRDLNISDEERKKWISYLQSFQDDDGLFKDPVGADGPVEHDSWGWWHLT